MSSFKRKTTSTKQPLLSGTRCSPALSTILLTSTGIPSFDDILGGGIQLGTDLLVLNSDTHSAHSELIAKYFVSQGLSNNQDLHVLHPLGRSLVETCMWTPASQSNSTGISNPTEDEGENPLAPEEADSVKIAWRYERMGKFKTTVVHSSSDQEDFCAPFDLANRAPPRIIDDALKIGRLNIPTEVFDSTSVYDAAITYIEERSLQVTSERVCRFCLPSFAGPEWGDSGPEVVLRFLFRLRSILRQSPMSCALITLPSYISADSWGGTGWTEKLGWLSDACVTLNSFSADPSMSTHFPSQHGLLVVHSLPRVQTLVPASDRFSNLRGLSAPSTSSSLGGMGENNLAFKCTRKRMLFETFHLDVEGGVGERRTAPSATAIAKQVESGTDRIPTSLVSAGGDEGAIAAMKIIVEDVAFSVPTSAMVRSEEKKIAPKRPRKKVGFQNERPELYDF